MKINKLTFLSSIIVLGTTVHAQSFYTCVPDNCPEGQYRVGSTCRPVPTIPQDCPEGQYRVGSTCVNAPTQQTTTSNCGSGLYLENGHCSICPIGYYCPGDNSKKRCKAESTKTVKLDNCSWIKYSITYCAYLGSVHETSNELSKEQGRGQSNGRACSK